jgi:hypothetical protein
LNESASRDSAPEAGADDNRVERLGRIHPP